MLAKHHAKAMNEQKCPFVWKLACKTLKQPSILLQLQIHQTFLNHWQNKCKSMRGYETA